MTRGPLARMIVVMRLLKLTVLLALAASLIPQAAVATPRPADACAALKGRDLAPGKGQRAVRRGTALRYCAPGGKVRRLGGSPSVRRADGRLLLLHRRGRVEVLDIGTGRRATLGPVAAIVHAEVVASAGVAAVRRGPTGDAVIVAAPGRAELLVEQGAAPVEAFDARPVLTWTRAGLSQSAQLPLRAVRCGDLRGTDQLAGPERLVTRGRGSAAVDVGCAGAPDAPTFVLGRAVAGQVPYLAHAGTWLLLDESSGDGRYYSSVAWSTLDLATGRTVHVASHSGGGLADETGDRLLEHVLLPDGRLVTLVESDFTDGVARASAVDVRGPGRPATTLDDTEGGAPKATGLRVEGDVVRWTVGGEERSAPLPRL